MRERVRHHAFAAGLVQHPLSPFDDDDLEACPRAVQRGGQTAGPPPPRAGRSRQARQRVVLHLDPGSSSTALSTVKTTAVIHAVCTSGSAIPSTTTAT